MEYVKYNYFYPDRADVRTHAHDNYGHHLLWYWKENYIDVYYVGYDNGAIGVHYYGFASD